MFEAFIGAVYFLHAGVFAMFVIVERNRNGGAWRLKHVVLMVGAATWPLLIGVALLAASFKAGSAAFSAVALMMSRAEGSNIEAGNRGQ
ncbi:hypothetical protein ABUK73_04485 [Agrobacterium sp. BA1120]|uniref:hypothetical protein n=1 Tax=Agrobacterium sp. BA1120 TaxID=3228927 RepID=UPI00336AC1EF